MPKWVRQSAVLCIIQLHLGVAQVKRVAHNPASHALVSAIRRDDSLTN